MIIYGIQVDAESCAALHAADLRSERFSASALPSIVNLYIYFLRLEENFRADVLDKFRGWFWAAQTPAAAGALMVNMVLCTIVFLLFYYASMSEVFNTHTPKTRMNITLNDIWCYHDFYHVRCTFQYPGTITPAI